MRQIQIVVPDRRVEEFMKLLANYDESPLHTKATGAFDTIVVHVDDEKVDELVEILRNKGVEEEGSIFLLPPCVTITKKEEEVEEKEKKKKIAPTVELIAQAEESSGLTRSFLYMTMISAFVATLGLLLDSVAVVIGAMVIAPLLGHSISICVGTVLGEPKLFRNALINTFIGLAVAIMVSIITAWVAVNSGLVTPLIDLSILPKGILERTNLNVLNIGLALASGAAGAYSFAERKGEILVGVMIAVALMPPACVAGIGIALLDIDILLGAILLLIVNVICINIAGTLVLWKIGVRPKLLFKEIESERRVRKRVTTTAIILIIISAIFVYSTYDAYLEYQLEEEIKREVGNIAKGLVNVTDMEVTSIKIDNNRIRVTVTLFLEEGVPPDNCAQIIKEGLEERWDDYDFEVVVDERQVAG